MIIQVGDVPVDLDDDGDRICIGLRKGKPFESESLAIWSTLCAKGGTVLDVGAYTGLYAIAAAKRGCRVTAFEPFPSNAARLVENVQRNDVAVTLIREAVSDFIGMSSFAFNPRVPFTSGGSLVARTGSTMPVRVTTIDLFGFDDVRAIKIDVERGEAAALRGARDTLARCRPHILLEVLDDECKAAVRAAVPDYRVAREIDDRNWLMEPV